MLVAQSCLWLLWPHGLYLSRLLRPWNFPGKNTEGGCHFLLQGNFPTQGSNPVSFIADGFFIIWVTRKALSFLNWSIIALQCCASFCYTTTTLYIYSLPLKPPSLGVYFWSTKLMFAKNSFLSLLLPLMPRVFQLNSPSLYQSEWFTKLKA